MKRSILILIVLLTATFLRADPVKKSLKLIAKRDWSKIESLLNKSLSKDLINPGARYVYSIVFLNPDYPGNNIDSAYRYILKAQVDYELLEFKEQEKLNRIHIDFKRLQVQKQRVDSAAFRVAVIRDTEEGYIRFINRHVTASQQEEAIRLRNAAAFRYASEIHTYESYLEFMNKYPQAEQVNQASKLYDFLLFESKTMDKKLESYVNFLEGYPETPYRDKAESEIYRISTAGNEYFSYSLFMEDYPESEFARKALDFLYHLSKEIEIPAIPVTDSLEQIFRLESYHLIPVFADRKYGFINEFGEEVFNYRFDAIENEYLCGGITSDFLKVVENGQNKLVSRDGNEIYRNVSAVTDIGLGLIRIFAGGRFGVVHKAGYEILRAEYQEIERAGRLIAFRQNGKWGLVSVSGKSILDAEYDEIKESNGVVVIRKGNRFAVTSTPGLVPAADGEKIDLDFDYDDVEFMEDGFIRVTSGDLTGLMDKEMKMLLPPVEQELIELELGYLLDREDGYGLFIPSLDIHKNQLYDDVVTNDKWIALRLQDKWQLLNLETSKYSRFEYDSLVLLSSEVSLLFQQDSLYARFTNDSLITIPENSSYRLQTYSFDDARKPVQYMMLTDGEEEGMVAIYNMEGRKIIEGQYDEIKPLGEEYLVIEEEGKKGLLSNEGEILLEVEFDAIGNYQKGSVSTLQDQMFGIFSIGDSISIPPTYRQLIRPLDERHLVASVNGKMGLLDYDNNNLWDFEFSQVKAWNDSTVLAMKENSWELVNVASSLVIYSGIIDFHIMVENDNETILLIEGPEGYGILSNVSGLILDTEYAEIRNLGSEDQPLYFAVKETGRSDLPYLVQYFKSNGEKVLAREYSAEDYDYIYCK